MMQHNQDPIKEVKDENSNPTIQFIEKDTKNKIDISTMRHSTAHLMAAAIQKLWPETQFGVGPSLENGFYYDFMLPKDAQLNMEEVEKMMNKIKKEKHKLERMEMSIDDAIKFMEEKKQSFKVELLKLLKEKGSTVVEKETGDKMAGSLEKNQTGVEVVSFYKLGDFVDLCRGPHVNRTDKIGAFKLNSQSSAYWRGNEKNPVLTRVYGLAFETKEELEKEVIRLEEIKLRDHRKIGKDLEIFAFSEDVGPGLALWLPNGMAMRQELELLAESTERKWGYKRVSTPVLTKETLFLKSGHLPYYAEDMYKPIVIEEEKYYLKPMNCPHHHQVYLNSLHSYRDLPIRLAEYGNVFRYESNGAMSGIMRTRGFTQNDAHIYCTHEQAKDEFLAVMKLHAYYYNLLDIKEFYMRLSLPDMTNISKYVDNPEEWKKAVEIIREAMKESGLPFIEVPGEAAFYGPKIDFMIKNVLGREYAISTNQLDFLATKNFNLVYTSKEGDKKPVYVIHRAPLGSHERFIAFLLEQYKGRFPTWLAPTQVRVCSVTDDFNNYAESIYKQLFDADIRTGTHGLRVDTDLTHGYKISKKIALAQEAQIPYMVIVGKKEEENKTISVRLRSGKEINNISIDEFIKRLEQEIYSRHDVVEKDENEIKSSPITKEGLFKRVEVKVETKDKEIEVMVKKL